MAQFETIKDELAGASLVYVAAEKRGGMFRPEKYFGAPVTSASQPASDVNDALYVLRAKIHGETRTHTISFPFLLDEDRRVTRAYGVYHAIGIDALNIAHPATFIVDRQGNLRMIYVGMDQRDRMPLQAILEVLRAIPKEAT